MSKDIEAFNWLNQNDLSYDIWSKKYRNGDESFGEWLDRVSNHDSEVAQLIKDKKFMFAGRTLANRGTNKGSMSNCYSYGYLPDSLDGIMDACKDIAMTFKAQGGQGISLSKIRPKGTSVGEHFSSDGIVPFMELLNTTTSSISQAGSRKGAIMISIDVWHKDAEEFIKIKSDLNKINKANLSLEIDDNFMKYVDLYYQTGEKHKVQIERNYDGHLVQYEVCPIDIWKLICQKAWEMAEPGIIFTNKFRNYNLMQYVDDYNIVTSNPCGEQPLAPHSACNLSSFNISSYVINPFTDKASFNYEELYHDVTVVTKAMDDIIDENINNHALEQQKEMSRKFRNIGIGIMGAADALLKLNCKYGIEESITFLQDVLRTMFRAALMTSAQLGKYRGNFPGYSEKIWDAEILRAAFNEDEIAALRQNNALRNCSLISIAPTGLK